MNIWLPHCTSCTVKDVAASVEEDARGGGQHQDGENNQLDKYTEQKRIEDVLMGDMRVTLWAFEAEGRLDAEPKQAVRVIHGVFQLLRSTLPFCLPPSCLFLRWENTTNKVAFE